MGAARLATAAGGLDTHTANHLVETHLYLVTHATHQLAQRFPRHIDREELWAAGAAGLVDASRRFDPDRGIPFARFAAARIQGAMIDSTRSRDWAPRRLRRDSRELDRAERQVEQAAGHTASRAELADALGITEDEVRRRQEAVERATLLHLDQSSHPDDEPPSLAATLVETDGQWLPDEAFELREERAAVALAIEHLDEPFAEVMRRYFFGGEMLSGIATSMGITEARVSQMCSEGTAAVRAWLSTTYPGLPSVATDAPGMRRRAAYLSRMRDSVSYGDWRSRLSPSRTSQPA